MSSHTGHPLLDDLVFRGLLHQITNPEGLKEHLGTPNRSGPARTIYCGFDPTADSLTIGNLVVIMVLAHLQRAGHRPCVVVGGGTGLIGDPSGKSAERQLLDEATVERHVASQRRIFESFLSFEGENAALIRNNADWITKLGFVEVLRDVGKHFSVNAMIQKDSVRERLHQREQGISYTEFSYMILQAIDFRHLFEHDQVTVQLGGSDQWGNIVSGVDLIRRQCQAEAFGLTAPLVTKADGGKFGKTETDAIWLTAERTSPYAYYQFWINTADADVGKFLKIFTFLTRDEIERLLEEHHSDPGRRHAQRTLAWEATRLLHGTAAAERSRTASEALFSGAVADLDEALLEEVFKDVPSSDHALSDLNGEGLALVELLPTTTLAKSKREAREFLGSGAVSLNGNPVSAEARLTQSALLFGKLALLRRGKRAWHVTRWA